MNLRDCANAGYYSRKYHETANQPNFIHPSPKAIAFSNKVYVSYRGRKLNDCEFKSIFIRFGMLRQAYQCISKQSSIDPNDNFNYGFVSFVHNIDAVRLIDLRQVFNNDLIFTIQPIKFKEEYVRHNLNSRKAARQYKKPLKENEFNTKKKISNGVQFIPKIDLKNLNKKREKQPQQKLQRAAELLNQKSQLVYSFFLASSYPQLTRKLIIPSRHSNENVRLNTINKTQEVESPNKKINNVLGKGKNSDLNKALRHNSQIDHLQTLSARKGNPQA